MLTYESTIESYRKILTKNPGKGLRIHESGGCEDVAILLGTTVCVATAIDEGSLYMYHLPPLTDRDWQDGGWHGKEQATQDAIDRPKLVSLQFKFAQKLAAELQVGDTFIAPSGYARTVESLEKHDDRICVVMTCNSDIVFPLGERLQIMTL